MEGCGRCFKCREGRGCIRTVSFAAASMPNRKPETVRINRTEAQWDKDMPAYKRIRQNGVQPKRIDNAAELETRANDQFEIEMGTVVPENRKSQVKEGLAISKELEIARPAGVKTNEA